MQGTHQGEGRTCSSHGPHSPEVILSWNQLWKSKAKRQREAGSEPVNTQPRGTRNIWVQWKVSLCVLPVLSTKLLFSCSVMSNSLQPHGLQHARLPCPSPSPGVCSNLCPLSQWCHPTISSSVIPFSSCPQSLPASQSFSMSQLSTWGGQSTTVSASASFPPKKSLGWSPSEWTGWISLQSRELRCILKEWFQWAQTLASSHT